MACTRYEPVMNVRRLLRTKVEGKLTAKPVSTKTYTQILPRR